MSRLEMLVEQHSVFVQKISDEWQRADAVMLNWQMAGCAIESGTYEKLASDERASALLLINQYRANVVDHLLSLIGEQLQRDLIVFGDYLLDTIRNPRRPWTDEIARQCLTIGRLLQAESQQIGSQRADPYAMFHVDIENNVVRFNGADYPVSAEGASLMLHLVRARGGLVSSRAMKNPSVGRPGRVRDNLPKELQALIESKHGSGFRLKSPD